MYSGAVFLFFILGLIGGYMARHQGRQSDIWYEYDHLFSLVEDLIEANTKYLDGIKVRDWDTVHLAEDRAQDAIRSLQEKVFDGRI